MASPFVELLGDTLLHSNMAAVGTAEALAGKTVGLYFSAHWCPPCVPELPDRGTRWRRRRARAKRSGAATLTRHRRAARRCRGFTPELADAYQALRAAGKPFEIVFVSSDRDPAQYTEYAAAMPWLSLPYCNRDVKIALSRRFKVDGIPTLVILDEKGELINADGRDAVGEDPAGFPWRPKPLIELLAGPLVDASGATRAPPSFGYVALYFGASWCDPCQEFTPQLIKAYEAARASGGQLEVVFVSAHSGLENWRDYIQHMPWLAVHHDDEDRISALSAACAVREIPRLVLCDAATGAIVNPWARSAVEAGRPFPDGWMPPLVLQMNEDDSSVESSLNETPALCVLAEICAPAVAAAAEAALAALAPPRGAKPPPGAVEMPALVIARDEGEVSKQIRSMCGLGDPAEQPHVLLLDLSSEGAFFTREPGTAAAPVCHGDACSIPGAAAVDEPFLRAFVADWRAGKLKRGKASKH